MRMDEVLASVADKIKNFAVIYLVDITEVPDFNAMYELYDPCAVMFFFRNKVGCWRYSMKQFQHAHAHTLSLFGVCIYVCIRLDVYVCIGMVHSYVDTHMYTTTFSTHTPGTHTQYQQRNYLENVVAINLRAVPLQ